MEVRQNSKVRIGCFCQVMKIETSGGMIQLSRQGDSGWEFVRLEIVSVPGKELE